MNQRTMLVHEAQAVSREVPLRTRNGTKLFLRGAAAGGGVTQLVPCEGEGGLLSAAPASF